MNKNIKMQAVSEDLSAAFTTNENHKDKPDGGEDGVHEMHGAHEMHEVHGAPGKHEAHGLGKKPKHKFNKVNLVMMIGGVVGMIGGLCLILVALLMSGEAVSELHFPIIPSDEAKEETYSVLTGEALADASGLTAPIYCIQTPNGTDGARPQAGLNTAGVIFEAVAEAGITRFAAIYQAPTTAIIGPIRSLRTYYLQWDTPFDCTIVHAGGSGDALAAVSAGGYKDLSEDYSYMYRGTYGGRLWNNLFTTSSALAQFSSEHGYNSEKARGFARMTPTESEHARIDSLAVNKLDIVKPSSGDTSALGNAVESITMRFGGMPNFNVKYAYDTASNKYLRSYESGVAHEVYSCAGEDLGQRNPEDVCSLTQMAPSVVIGMVVSESRAADNYHEDITTVGSGDAYIFQNGTAIRGTWRKDSVADQIKFSNSGGEEIRLAPGQTIISAIPGYGGVDF